jgi:shikimate kinase
MDLTDQPGKSTSPAVRRIALTGFMGAGKTTVGNLLAVRLSWRFLDADAEIEAATGRTIAQLFEERGEPWFRHFEYESIRELLDSEALVLALGGGAIEDSRTRDLLLRDEGTLLIHLEASFETVLERCHGTETVRPVLRDRPNLESRYHRRLPLYRESHLTIAVDALPPTVVVDHILTQVAAQIKDQPGTSG